MNHICLNFLNTFISWDFEICLSDEDDYDLHAWLDFLIERKIDFYLENFSTENKGVSKDEDS